MAYRFKHGDRPLDDYTIQRAVGTGGFGEVYYAVSDGGREVALKYLRQNPQVELRGVSHCINLKSPHLVSIFDVKKNAEGDYFVIMEYCSGPSLRDLLIAEPNGFAPEKAAFFVREIAKGLSYLHERGIVHRDLKPGNIFYDDGYVKIGDYGLSKFIAVSRHSAQTVSVGTVHYMAPEIGSGDYSRGVDIYALGVMLYEMLMGRVPFEGSSMAEILMKHLTSQPEVENLPEPFGEVIQKALQKDPKDRYQRVEAMLDDLLAVETVKQSLAGFSPRSLEGAVRLGGRDHADSPLPSPNPAPAGAMYGGRAGGARVRILGGRKHGPLRAEDVAVVLPERVARQIEHISQRVEQKVARLAGRPYAPRPRVRAGRGRRSPAAYERVARGKRALPALMLSAALVIGMGVLFGTSMDEDEIGIAAALLSAFMPIGVGLSNLASRWFGAQAGPRWAGSVVRVAACAPLLFLGTAPLVDLARFESEALGVVIGLLVVALFGDWTRVRDSGADGELSIGGAVWMGFGAGLVSAIAAGILDANEPQQAMFLSAAIAAAAVLIVQANTWWLVSSPARPTQPGQPGQSSADSAEPSVDDSATETTTSPAGDDCCPPFAYPIDHPANLRRRRDAAHRAEGDDGDPRDAGGSTPRRRWWLTRALWSVVAFVLMGGMLVTFLIALINSDMSYDDCTGSIVGCIACGCMMIFALCKTTMVKRDGFWRETLRPFLILTMMVGIGAAITLLARGFGVYEHSYEYATGQVIAASGGHWYRPLHDDEVIGWVTGLVLCSLLFIILTLFTGRKRRPRPRFVMVSSDKRAQAEQQADEATEVRA